jgi:cellulose synthase/poly-beta-1,6-N-acetylglucosamine synthase-like glycosyltransferase
MTRRANFGKRLPKISIIIPLYIAEDRFFRDLKKFNKLDYANYEILVVSDKRVEIKNPKVKIILSGKKRTGPAEKRDIALKQVKGKYCAFIDDDAYPDKNWLKNAVVHFNHPKIAAVGGPGLTPKEDNYWEQITGLIYLSPLCGGPTQHRFIKANIAFVDDFPAYNLIVRTDVLKSVGGYGSHFYGGEDTFLCLKIVKKGWKILYDPEVTVYHHRRPLLVPYLKQISNIGKHRGYFAKTFPETSFRLFYFLPSIATVGLISLLIFSFFNNTALLIFMGLLIASILLAALSVVRRTIILESLIVAVGIILTHISYGTAFIRGFMSSKLTR